MEPEQKLEYDKLRKAEKLWEKALKGVNEENNNQNIKYAVEKNKKIKYNNMKIGETKVIDIENVIDLVSHGGYRTEEQIND